MKPSRMMALCLAALWSLAVFRGMGNAAEPREREKKGPAELIRIVKSSAHVEDRDAAIKALGEITDERQLEMYNVPDFLLEIAQNRSSHPRLRDRAIRSIGNITMRSKTSLRERYMTPFAKLLEDRKEDPNVRHAIIEVFRNILRFDEVKDRKTMESVEKVAGDRQEEPWLRAAAFECMGEVGTDEKGMRTILANLRESTPELKRAVLDALLRRVRESDAQLDLPTVNTLVSIIQDKEVKSDARVAAMKAVAESGRKGGPGKAAVPEILKVMKDGTDMVLVMGAIEAIGILADDEALQTILDISEEKFFAGDEGAPARAAICRALGGYLTAFETKSRAQAEEIGRKCRDRLMKYIETDKNQGVRRRAIYNLGLMASPVYDSLKKPAVDLLIDELYAAKKAGATGGEALELITEALRYLTRVNHGDDVDKWDDWFRRTYGGGGKERKK
ncbi:MAG: hypothetical protein N3A38_13450 [Planctomycetota bacterium]|nr:hypothetical protein [Planctomycetota bacterium]